MFEKISFSIYGRCVREEEWTVSNFIGTNRLHYIHSGNVLCQCGENIIQLNEKHLYLFPQNLSFRLITNSDTCVDHTFFDFWTIPAIKMENALDINYTNHSLIYKGMDALIEIGNKFPMYPVIKRNRYYNIAKSYLNNLLYIINDIFPIETITDSTISAAIAYIHEHYYSNISIKELAKSARLNTGSFIEKFKLCTNQTPLQYIKTHRLNISYNLLKTKRYSLSEIAEMVGYQDAAAFSHAFKKAYGASPKYIDKI